MPSIVLPFLLGYLPIVRPETYTAHIFLHAWISPLQREGKMVPMPWRRWGYPYEQSDLVFSKGYDEYYKELRASWDGPVVPPNPQAPRLIVLDKRTGRLVAYDADTGECYWIHDTRSYRHNGGRFGKGPVIR